MYINKRFSSLVIFCLCVLLLSPGMKALHTEAALDGSVIKTGDYITFGSYKGRPIVWQVIHLDASGNPLLFSHKILSLKAFDAAGPYHQTSIRQKYGSNAYISSNLRQWLNSEAKSIKWLQNPPTADRMLDKAQPYDQEPGFLSDTNFKGWERSLIRPLTHKIVLHKSDADQKEGGTSSFLYQSLIDRAVQNYDANAYYKMTTDKVFLLSVKQLKEYVQNRGFDIRAKPTLQAVSGAADEYAGLGTKEYWHYWLSTPNGQHGGSVRFVFFDGMVNKHFANSEVIGVRPALMLFGNKIRMATSGDGSLTKPYVVLSTSTTSENTNVAKKFEIRGGKLYINNKLVTASKGATTAVIKGQTVVSATAALKSMGLSLSWDNSIKTLIATKKNYSIRIKPGSNTVLVNMQTNKKMSVPATYVNGTLMIPAQFIARELGYQFSSSSR